MTLSFRPGLERVTAYTPGRAAPVGATGRSIKLSSNENPFPPLPSVVERLREVLPEAVSRYPDLAAPAVTEALAERFAVTPSNIVLGSGSVEVASQFIHALTAPGDEVVFAWRSFEAYPILTRVAGAVPVAVPLDAEGRHDLDAMAAAVTERTRLVFVCNPNNPTGTVVTTTALEAFLARMPDRVLVVLDEAYAQFDRDPASPSGPALFARHPNLAVLHTFSKAYGLAGLRIGYAVAAAEVAGELRKTALPFAVTRLAQEAALASLDSVAQAELDARVQRIVEERERLAAGLAARGVRVATSQANFLWWAGGDRSEVLGDALHASGIAARVFPGEGVRLTVGSPEENDAVLAAVGTMGPVALDPTGVGA